MNLTRPLTAIERETLTVLSKAAEPLMAREVAMDLWPDAKGWARQSACGNRNTSRVGGQMGGAAGLILRRLERRGLVRVSDDERERNPNLRYIPHFSLTVSGETTIQNGDSQC